MSAYTNAVGDILFRDAGVGDSIPQANTLTAAGWLKIVSDINAGTAIFERYGDTAGAVWQGIYIDPTGTGVRVNNSGGSASASTEIGVGVWVHVAYVRNGATHTLHVNGVALQTSTGTPSADTTASFAFGGNGVTNTGDLEFAQWRIWESALTTEELRAEMVAAVPVRTANLWADYRMEPDALTVDSSGNARTLRVNGTVVNGASEPVLPVPGAAVLLTAAASTVNGTSYTTGNITYTAGELILLYVYTDTDGSGTPVPPTSITAPAGLSFALQDDVDGDAGFLNLSLWRAEATANGSGTLQINSDG